MRLTLEQLIEKIDANTKVVCDIEYEKKETIRFIDWITKL